MDTDNIIKWRNSKNVISKFLYQDKMTKEVHEKWYNTRILTGEVAQFIINDGQNDIGSVYLRDIDKKNSKAEFGIFIGEDIARGKGHGLEATKLILKYAFNDLLLNKVFLRVLAENTGAIKTYQRAGFTQEGYFKSEVLLDGIYKDIIFMAITKKEWETING